MSYRLDKHKDLKTREFCSGSNSAVNENELCHICGVVDATDNLAGTCVECHQLQYVKWVNDESDS